MLPFSQEALRPHISTLSHVPKAAKSQENKVLTDLLERLATFPPSSPPKAHVLHLPQSLLPNSLSKGMPSPSQG